MELQTLWLVLAAVLVILGFAGLILPALPGPPLLLGGLALAAWAEDFRHVGAASLAVMTLLCVLMVAVDFIAGSLGAKRFGASPRAALGAALGAFAGFWFGPVGFIVGPFAGAVLGELSARRTLQQAGRAGVGATIGLVLGTAAKLALGVAMLGIYLFARIA